MTGAYEMKGLAKIEGLKEIIYIRTAVCTSRLTIRLRKERFSWI